MSATKSVASLKPVQELTAWIPAAPDLAWPWASAVTPVNIKNFRGEIQLMCI